MAGEWIPIDCNIATKPEVLELVELTGCEPDQAVGRMVMFWGWAALNCEDGVAKMTPPRLVRLFGGDVQFWEAVEQAGWIAFDKTAATVSVPKWGERFSQAAKSRALHARRAAASEPDRKSPALKRRVSCAQAQGPLRTSAVEEREEREEKEDPPPPRACAWEDLRAAWNAGPGRPWKPAEPPDEAVERLSESGWYDDAVTAISCLKACRYFKTPVSLTQFCGAGFVRRVIQGRYDDVHESRKAAPDEKPAPRVDPAFAAAREATERRERERMEAEHRRLDEKATSATGATGPRLKLVTQGGEVP